MQLHLTVPDNFDLYATLTDHFGNDGLGKLIFESIRHLSDYVDGDEKMRLATINRLVLLDDVLKGYRSAYQEKEQRYFNRAKGQFPGDPLMT